MTSVVQLRVQGVAPGGVVVGVAHLDEFGRDSPTRPSVAAIARLFARFSSATPQVNTVGHRVTRPVPARDASATKPVTAAKPEKALSCGSRPGVKKLPDCSSSPSNVPGCERWACSMASPPRLTPTPMRTVVASGERGEHLDAQRVGVGGVRGVPAVAVRRRQQQRP